MLLVPFMCYYYLFGVFLSQYDFQVSFSLKIQLILYLAKIIQNTLTERHARKTE